MARVDSFITVETNLSSRLYSAWRRTVAAKAMQDVQVALGRHDFAEAHRIAQGLSFAQVISEHQGYVDTLAVSAFLLGQSFFAKGRVADGQVASGKAPLPSEVYVASAAFTAALEQVGAEDVRDALAVLIHEEELAYATKQQEITKSVIPGLAAKLNAAVAGTGKAAIDVGANLTTSRLVSYGALSQAADSGVTQYQVSEILDDRTCPVCQAMNGMTFDVADAAARLQAQLSVQDPMELKTAAPFPAQSRGGLDALSRMTKEDLVSRGWNTPPYHPNCRGVLVPVGTVSPSSISGLGGLRAALPEAPAPTPAPAPVEAAPSILASPATLPEVAPAALPPIQRPKVLPVTEAQKLTARISADAMRGPEDLKLKELQRAQNFDATPHVASQAEFDALVASGDIQVAGYRGLTPAFPPNIGQDRIPAQTLAEQFKRGPLFAGRGIYGSGTYAALGTDTEHALMVAKGYAGQDGVLLRLGLRRGAKVIDARDLTTLAIEESEAFLETRKPGFDEFVAKEKLARTPEEKNAVFEAGLAYDAESHRLEQEVFGDLGRFATTKGYDAIRGYSLGEHYSEFVVLNRSALVVQEELVPAVGG